MRFTSALPMLALLGASLAAPQPKPVVYVHHYLPFFTVLIYPLALRSVHFHLVRVDLHTYVTCFLIASHSRPSPN